MRRALLAIVLLALIIGWPAHARAHVRSVSYSTWTVHGDEAAVQVTVPAADLAAHPPFAALVLGPLGSDGEKAIGEYFERSVRMESDAGACAVDAESRRAPVSVDDAVVRQWRVRCGSKPRRIVSDLLFDDTPSHLHFAAIERDEAAVVEHLLTHDARAWVIGPDEEPSGIADFVVLGVRHVASGPDHIVFVLTLLVVAASLRAVAGVVTGFTLGHSATLAVAVLGGVRPDVSTVESLVGASIAVVAVENVWIERRDPWLPRGLVACLALAAILAAAGGRQAALALAGLTLFVTCYHGLLARAARPERMRWTVAALFGTVHGLAFSGALTELHLGRARLAGALLGFNLGVEIAQLALVAIAWPLWRLVVRTGMRPRAVEIASAAALAAGAFWFVDRAFG